MWPGCAWTAGQVLRRGDDTSRGFAGCVGVCPGQVEKDLSEPRWKGLDLPFSLPSPPALPLLCCTHAGPGRQQCQKPRGEVPQRVLGILAQPWFRACKRSHDCSHPSGGQRKSFLLPEHQLRHHPPSPSVTSGSLSACAHSRSFPGSTLLAAGSLCLPCCSVFPWLVSTSFIPFSLALSKYSCLGLI